MGVCGSRLNDGVGLAVEVAGEGPGLLLVHGLGGAKEDFADHVPTLARPHRGRLRPSRPRCERQARPIRRVLVRPARDRHARRSPTRTGLDRFRLLGHSMGGMVARKIAIREPERVDALVMMDTSRRSDPRASIRRSMDIACRGRAHRGQAGAEGAARHRAACSRRRRTSARSPSGPGYRRVRGAQVGRAVGDHVGRDGASSSRTSPTISPRCGRACAARCSCSSASRTSRSSSRRTRWPRRSRRRSSRSSPTRATRRSSRTRRAGSPR